MKTLDPTVLRIDERKIELGLKDWQIENYIGATRGTLSKWRRTNVKSYTDYLVKLSEILQTSIAYLMCETDDPRIQLPATDRDGLSDREQRAIELMRQLPEPVLDSILLRLEEAVHSLQALDSPL